MDLRTETEVAEAFFSASNGSMDMLNNMLGTQYKTFEEAQKGIAKNQGGLVEEMSATVPGLISTVTGKAKVGLKNFVKVFQEPLTGALNKVIEFIDNVSPAIEAFAGKLLSFDFGAFFASFDFGAMTTALQPVIDLFSGFFTAIETRSPVVMGIMQILGTVWNTIWTAIGAVINAVKPIVEKIFVFIGQHGEEISNIIDALGVVWKAVWNTVGALLQGAWFIVEPILSGLLKALSSIADMVRKVGNWWSDMVNKIKNNPIVEAAGNAWNTVTGFFGGGRSAYGTNRVARNDTPYRLHEGERILTKQEANMMDRGMLGGQQGVSISIGNMTVREEADINKVAKELVRELKLAKYSYGGAF